MQTIIVATDLEPKTTNALLRSIQLAYDNKAKLHIVHVIHILSSPIFEDKAQKAEEEGRIQILNLIKKHPNCDDVDYDIHILHDGRVQDQIAAFARKTNADLVIMGADRSSMGTPSFIRSKVEHLMWQGDYPVLSAFTDVTHAYNNILVVGKKHIANMVDLLDINRQEKIQRRFINSVHKTLTGVNKTSKNKQYKYANKMSSFDLISKIKSENYDLTVLEVESLNLSQPDFGEDIHKILMDESCDILLIRK